MFGLSYAQILVSCNNVTDCVSCAKAQFAREGASTCTWCTTSNLCFDRSAEPDECPPSASVTLTDAGSRCSSLFGLPVAYGVLILLIIILVPIVVVVSIVLVRRRLRDKQLKNMLKYAERADSVKQSPISITAGVDDLNYTASGSTTPIFNSTSNPAISAVKGSRGRRGSRSASRKSSQNKLDPLLEGANKQEKSDNKSLSSSDTRYVPPSLTAGSKGRRNRRSRASNSVDTSESSEKSDDSSAS